MNAALCRQCGGYGFDRDNRVCTLCAGSGKDPYEKAPGSAPPPIRRGRTRGTRPVPDTLKRAALGAALLSGVVAYANTGSLEDAGLAVLVVAVLGLLAGYVLANVLTFAILGVTAYAADRMVFEGQLLPRMAQIARDGADAVLGLLF